MTSLHVTCGLGPQSKIVATPMFNFKTLHFGLNFESNLAQGEGKQDALPSAIFLVVNCKSLKELPCRVLFPHENNQFLGVTVHV